MMVTIRMKQLLFFSVSWLFCLSVWAQNPKITKIDQGWKFYPGGLEFAETPAMSDSLWQKISIPHTWNATDPFTDNHT
ncbi:hypothetical protein ABIB40_002511 [Pedobacter sp. UYP30]|uniref:hypothetical protein n=1 Tax=Pedobacter sp. UYP30 TaxID=1756400 RepID=UPI0033939177